MVDGPAQVLGHRDGKLKGEGLVHQLVRSLSRPGYRLRQGLSCFLQPEEPAQDPLHLEARQEGHSR